MSWVNRVRHERIRQALTGIRRGHQSSSINRGLARSVLENNQGTIVD
ncbi:MULTISPECIES: hypothetical protein [unclassified Nostoc]|nr:hypothetical protein [Nostoc sp. DedQUE03]MDZ7973702.1 hypothetical protein [Nostoc sp. DedQUE03]MDZ8048185.1 hypothetical protein [Nostoc sp. DedQUE02]